jgi:hypothetical protein
MNGLTHNGVECSCHCRTFKHYASNCPNGTDHSVTTLTQLAIMMAQANTHSIDPVWILLDSQSTISVFNNPAMMLTNMRKSAHTLHALTNGGHRDSDMEGDFSNLGIVWYNPLSIANILSLVNVRNVCRVTLDTSSNKPALCVHRLNEGVMKFIEQDSRLYIYDSAARKRTCESVTASAMVSTVAEQRNCSHDARSKRRTQLVTFVERSDAQATKSSALSSRGT